LVYGPDKKLVKSGAAAKVKSDMTRYHYNKNGEYRGCTTHKAPASSTEALGYIGMGLLALAALYAAAPYLLVGGTVWGGCKIWKAFSK
jgi:hypothetical protein